MCLLSVQVTFKEPVDNPEEMLDFAYDSTVMTCGPLITLRRMWLGATYESFKRSMTRQMDDDCGLYGLEHRPWLHRNGDAAETHQKSKY
jgi:hypothetical protein